MITKLIDQFPMHGRHCTFFMLDGRTIEGHWEHGGARDRPSIVFYEKAVANLTEDKFNTVLSWEYKEK